MLKYIFYRLYLIQFNSSNSSIAELVATILLTFLMSINLITVFGFLYVIFGKMPLPELSRVAIIIILIIPGLILYYSYARKSKIEKIKEFYKEESEKEKIKGKRIAIMYWVFTPIVFVISMLFMVLKNRGDL